MHYWADKVGMPLVGPRANSLFILLGQPAMLAPGHVHFGEKVSAWLLIVPLANKSSTAVVNRKQTDSS
jgi:hypothetical protein